MSRLLVSDQPISTQLIAEANDSFSRLSGNVDQILQIGRTVVPDGWMPWLLRNAGLQALMPYVDWETLWAKGPAWLSIRGTPQASIDALSWIGWDIRFEDGEAGKALYDHYQIHLDRIPNRQDLEQIVGVERVAKSSDSRFFRLIHGYDVRAVRGGRSRFGSVLFGRASGVDLRPDWPRLSFRAAGVMFWPASTQHHAAETLTVSAWVHRRGDIVTGFSRFGARPSLGPTYSIELSDSVTLTGRQADHRSTDMPRPVAGIVGGRTRFASRQAVFLATRLVPGESVRTGAYRFGQRMRFGRIERVLRVPDPIDLTAMIATRTTVALHERLTDLTLVNGEPITSTSEALDGIRRLASIVTLDLAPWSGLPWGDQPFGQSPSTLSTEETP